MLFCYGGLQRSTGPSNNLALRAEIPELLKVAKEVRSRELIGIAAYKPANSHPEKEEKVFDFVGMLGLPLVPCHEFPTNAPAAFFSVHALKDPGFAAKLGSFIKAGKPVLLTDGLVQRLSNRVDVAASNVRILPVKSQPKSLLQLGEKELNDLQRFMMTPFKTSFRSPSQVGFYLFRDGSWVVENFNDHTARVELTGKAVPVKARSWVYNWK
jgi:hypothetical protein